MTGHGVFMKRDVFAGDGVLALCAYLPEDCAADYADWFDPDTRSGYNGFVPSGGFEAFQKRERPRGLYCSIVALAETTCIGVIMIDPEQPDIAIRIFRPYRGNGYGTRAFRLAVRYAFETLGYREVFAGCYPWNVRSRQMLASCGFVPHPETNQTKQHYETGEEIVEYDYVCRNPAFSCGCDVPGAK